MNQESKTTSKTNKVVLIIIIGLSILLILLGIYFLILKDSKKEEKKETPTEEKEEKENINYDKYEYTYGMLIPMSDDNWNPLQKDFIIDGIILIGNKHNYFDLEAGSEEIINKYLEDGYKTDGINSFFYTDEEIRIYLDSKNKIKEEELKVLAIPIKKKKELRESTYESLKKEAEEKGFLLEVQTPTEENHNYIGSGTIQKEENAGQYTIVFIYQKKVIYYMDMIVAIEPKG